MSLSLRYLSARYRIHGALEVSTTLVFDLRGNRGGGGCDVGTWGQEPGGRVGQEPRAVSGRRAPKFTAAAGSLHPRVLTSQGVTLYAFRHRLRATSGCTGYRATEECGATVALSSARVSTYIRDPSP